MARCIDIIFVWNFHRAMLLFQWIRPYICVRVSVCCARVWWSVQCHGITVSLQIRDNGKETNASKAYVESALHFRRSGGPRPIMGKMVKSARQLTGIWVV